MSSSLRSLLPLCDLHKDVAALRAAEQPEPCARADPGFGERTVEIVQNAPIRRVVPAWPYGLMTVPSLRRVVPHE